MFFFKVIGLTIDFLVPMIAVTAIASIALPDIKKLERQIENDQKKRLPQSDCGIMENMAVSLTSKVIAKSSTLTYDNYIAFIIVYVTYMDGCKEKYIGVFNNWIRYT